MSPEVVKRVVLKNIEHILIDLSSQENFNGETKCNISFKLIDGTGQESPETFNIDNAYEYIIDKNTDQKISVNGDTIKNISIKSGHISLEMSLKKEANPSLKFIYFVEV